MFTPAFVAVRQGDKVRLTAFVVNGDEQEVYITGPDGIRVVPATLWKRGRERHHPQPRRNLTASGPSQGGGSCALTT